MKVPYSELELRRSKVKSLMSAQGIDATLITCNVDLLYTCGAVASGWLYLPVEGDAVLFLKRIGGVKEDCGGVRIRKPEEIIGYLAEHGYALPKTIMLEGEELSYTEYGRLAACFSEAVVTPVGTRILREARSIKTPWEIDVFRRSGEDHARAYNRIPSVYRPGMTDLQLSIEVERLMRLEGSLGIFRVFGRSMEIFMGSLLAGDNAGTPSPYDFALGGAGLDPALPGGLDGSLIKEGQSVMVDMGGNFYGYMGDMSRVYSAGHLPDKAYEAHDVCLQVQDAVAELARPGAVCEDLYYAGIEIVKQSGWADCFMGTDQQAKFIGHGVGLEINEAPVIAPRMKQKLKEGMVFALEPKIVVPGVGPVGIENTWTVTAAGVEKLTLCPEEIRQLGS